MLLAATPLSVDAFKFGTFVVLVTVNGAVPIATVEIRVGALTASVEVIVAAVVTPSSRCAFAALACRPEPCRNCPLVNAAAEVTHVAQAIVPVCVIVPPVIGAVVAMLVTVPLPPADPPL